MILCLKWPTTEFPLFLRSEPTRSEAWGQHLLVPPPPEGIDFLLGQCLTPQNKTMKGRLSSSLTIYFFMGFKQEQRGLCPTMQQNRKQYTHRDSHRNTEAGEVGKLNHSQVREEGTGDY